MTRNSGASIHEKVSGERCIAHGGTRAGDRAIGHATLTARGENSAYEILENEGQLQVSAALPVAA
jgi:hypothetical protein